MSSADYSSIYSIKEFASDNILPNFFDENTNTFNVGLLGFINEMIGNVTEDTFNAMSFYLQESNLSTAKLRQTIYSSLAKYRYSDIFATASETNLAIFISENDIITLGEKSINELTDEITYTFILDRDMVVDVNGYTYMMDYDLKVTAKVYKDDYIFQAKYDKTFDNTISKINSPYLTTKRVNVSKKKYLMISVTGVHQITKTVQEESLISNDVLNMPQLSFEYDGELCGFNIFYRETEASDLQQLEPLLYNSAPLTTPFCFYKMSGTNKVIISFTGKDDYFQPEFGGEVIIEYYTTEGKDGDFAQYNGTDINVTPGSKTYDYNNGLIVFAAVTSSSTGGKNMPTFEELRAKALELATTADNISSESDIDTYFMNFTNVYGNKLKFAKLRDDVLARKYVAFALLKDGLNNIYKTNSLNFKLSTTNGDMDKEYAQSNRWMISPGRVFTFAEDSKETLVPLGHLTVNDDLTGYQDKILFASPFLISISKYPQSSSFYINTIDTQVRVDYKYANETSFYQFNCNKLTITRDAIGGETSYIVRVVITPTSSLDTGEASGSEEEELDEDDYTTDDTIEVDEEETVEEGEEEESSVIDNIKVILFVHTGDTRTGYIPLEFQAHEEEGDLYTYQAIIETDDYISSDNAIRFTNLYDYSTHEKTGSTLADMSDSIVGLAIFYDTDEVEVNHEFVSIPELAEIPLTNVYITETEKCDFIRPMDIIESTVTYLEETMTTTGMNDVVIEEIPSASATSETDGNSIEIEWDVYPGDTTDIDISYFLVYDEEFDKYIELDKADIVVEDDKCSYVINDLTAGETKNISVGYKAVSNPSNANFESYIYNCDCNATSGLKNVNKNCDVCGTTVKQFSFNDNFKYSCECGGITGSANVRLECGTCGTKCLRIIPTVTDRYACNCGALRGENKKGFICAICKSPVINTFDSEDYSYSCKCGNLARFEDLGNICDVCGEQCRRLYVGLSNNTVAMTISDNMSIVVGSGETVTVDDTKADIESYEISAPYSPTLMTLINKTFESFSVKLGLVPCLSTEELTENYFDLLENLNVTYEQIKEMTTKLHNNFSIVLKFYNTYGYSKNYTIDTGASVGTVNIKLKFAVKLAEGAIVDDIFNDIKIYVKELIETSSSNGSNNIYMSNITTEIENRFSDVKYCKFMGLNDFEPEIQIIEDNTISDLSVLSKEDRLVYIPEYLTIEISDISITAL